MQAVRKGPWKLHTKITGKTHIDFLRGNYRYCLTWT
jgi:hypothetical protein